MACDTGRRSLLTYYVQHGVTDVMHSCVQAVIDAGRER